MCTVVLEPKTWAKMSQTHSPRTAKRCKSIDWGVFNVSSRWLESRKRKVNGLNDIAGNPPGSVQAGGPCRFLPAACAEDERRPRCAGLGETTKIIVNLTAIQKMLMYPDMKVTFNAGKVTKIQ